MRHPIGALFVALLLSTGLAGCSPQAIGPQSQHDPTSDASGMESGELATTPLLPRERARGWHSC